MDVQHSYWWLSMPSSTHGGLGSNLWDDATYGLSLLVVLFLAQSFLSTLKPTFWIFKFLFDPERYTQVGTLLIDMLPLNCYLFIFYINTNEIPGELLHENLISSHVKITCYPHMWKYHRCYGYIINRTF